MTDSEYEMPFLDFTTLTVVGTILRPKQMKPKDEDDKRLEPRRTIGWCVFIAVDLAILGYLFTSSV